MDQVQPTNTTTTAPDIDFYQALFTQTDWDDRVCRETWWGRHGPYRRMLAFVSLSSWCWTLSTLFSLYVVPDSSVVNIPILQARTSHELDQIKQSHRQCLQSLCDEVGRTARIDCIVNDDGVSSRVEYGEHVPEFIDYPEACHQAIEITFGARYLESNHVAFMALQRESPDNATTQDRVMTLVTLLPDCSVVMSDPDRSPEEVQAIMEHLNMGGKDWDDLYREFNNQQEQRPELASISLSFNLMNLVRNRQVLPGHRENRILKNMFCMEEMHDDIRKEVLPSLAMGYNFLMDYRHEILAISLYFTSLCFSFLTVAWLMVRIIFPSMVMKRVLFWPEGIRTVDIWRMLLLLCLSTSFRLMSPALAAVLAVGALGRKNFKAALEWCFLGVLAWAGPDTIYPFLDDVLGQHLAKIDGLNILYYALHLFVIGEGWWKLVTCYVVYRAYQSLFESIQTQTPLEQTQLRLDGNNNMTNGDEHVKID